MTIGSPRSYYSDLASDERELKQTYLRNVLVLFVLLAVIIDQYSTHTEVRDNRRMLFLWGGQI